MLLVFMTTHPFKFHGGVCSVRLSQGGCNSSYTQRAFRRPQKKYDVEPQKRDLSSVFTTVGDQKSLWHLQFFNAVMLESHRLIEEERSSRMTSALCS